MNRRILVPLNGTCDAEAALLPALVVAATARAELHLLWVIEPPPGNRRLSKLVTEAVDQATFYLAARYLTRVFSSYAARRWSLTVRCAIRKGAVHRAILQLVEERGIDLVVMATHGHGRLKRRLFGSISERVAGAGRSPVLLVPTSLSLWHLADDGD